MNFDEAIQAHVQWKMKLRQHLGGAQKFDAGVVGKDDQCVLGKWIHGEASTKYRQLPDYAKLKAAHASFHATAASVIRTHDSGLGVKAAELLEGLYEKASLEVVHHIRHIRKVIEG